MPSQDFADRMDRDGQGTGRNRGTLDRRRIRRDAALRLALRGKIGLSLQASGLQGAGNGDARFRRANCHKDVVTEATSVERDSHLANGDPALMGQGREKQEVFPAASRDGSTAARNMSSESRLHAF